jgi:hypothetical protein
MSDIKFLVEGATDKYFLDAVFKILNIKIDVTHCKGYPNLKTNYLPALLDRGENTVVIVDADNDASQKWTDIKSVFLNKGITLPKEISPLGLIHKEDDRIFGIWIMPNNLDEGELETFIEKLIPENDLLFKAVLTFIDQLEINGIKRHKPDDESKAKINTFLALQNPPDIHMEELFKQRILQPENTPYFNNFKNWLNALLTTNT